MKLRIYQFKSYIIALFISIISFSCQEGNSNERKDRILSSMKAKNEAGHDLDENSFSNIKNFDSETLRDQLKESVESAESGKYFPENNERKDLHRKLKDLYEEKSYDLIWISPEGLFPQAEDLLQSIRNCSEDGLVPEHYHLKNIEQKIDNLTNQNVEKGQQELSDLDILLTSSYLGLASDMLTGRLNPRKFEDWMPDVPEKNLKDHLKEALENNEITSSIQELSPEHPQYQKLKEALKKYKEIAANGGWPVIDADANLKIGDSTKTVADLKERLFLTGDLQSFDSKKDEKYQFDDDLEAAIKKFQSRNGLVVDGIVGPGTLEEMNITVEDRINQIMLNMERIRWQPRYYGDKYILVNVPEYMLRIYENEEVVEEMKVIVGKEYYSTPIFNEEMTYLVFSPDWTLPISIATRDILPKVKEDPDYLIRNHYEVYEDWNEDSEPVDPFSIDWEDITEEEFNFRIVQKPGPWNSLGQVKFMMPNDMAIYLHDTPSDHLFNAQEREFSSGCIRVERPLDLTEYVLQSDPSWDRSRIYKSLNLEEPKNVILSEKINVHIVYKTCWIDDEGEIHFLQDIYGHDETQLTALENSMDLS
ncbi:L,D-transpeptidase family protein [soil metagenome]